MAECRDRAVNLLKTKYAERLYGEVKDLPIIDYHCHLSPKEIYEDRQFGNIGEMWLSGDHYKWRLMRAYGIDERYITGDADYREKFLAFARGGKRVRQSDKGLGCVGTGIFLRYKNSFQRSDRGRNMGASQFGYRT